MVDFSEYVKLTCPITLESREILKFLLFFSCEFFFISASFALMSSKARSSALVKGETRVRKRKKKMPSPSASPVTESIMSLPYDLLFNCFARVSRLYYPTFSLVSKTFLSIVYSSELYETRSRLSRTEKCLYLCLHFPSDTNTYWVTLYRKPNGNVADKSSSYLLVQVPSPNCRQRLVHLG